MIKANARVRITGEAGLAAVGRVEEIRTVADMPDLAEKGFPTLGEFAPKSILREWGVTRVAAITYSTSPNAQFMFAALEIEGEWFDMKRQRLALEVVGWYGPVQ